MPFVRGQVVAMRHGSVGVVWQASDRHVWVSPVGGFQNGEPHHRAEVRVTTKEDAEAMGVSLRDPVVRCQSMIKLDVHRLSAPRPVGQTPPSLLNRIVQSVHAEARRQQDEVRMAFIYRGGTKQSAVAL